MCHACGDHYSHPLLNETVLSAASKASAVPRAAVDHREPLAIIGGTGYVGRCLAVQLVDHPTFRLGAIVGSAATIGKPFSAVFEKKEDALVEHYGAELWKPQEFPLELMRERVVSVDEVIERGECKAALSFIAPEHGEIEDRLAAAGIKVFSISPHARFDPANPLSVPEANPEVLAAAVEEAAALAIIDPPAATLSLVKSPNCVTCGVVVALKALDDAFGGVEDVSVTTFQSLSGRGDAKYPRDVVMGNVYPLHGTVERTGEFQHRELKRMMPGVKRVSVAAYRVPTQKGHLVDVRVRFRKNFVGSARDIKAALEAFDPLKNVPLPSKPRKAIYVKPLDEDAFGADDEEAGGGGVGGGNADAGGMGAEGSGEGRGHQKRRPPPPRMGTPRPKDDCEFEDGMSICVGNIVTDDEMYDVKFCLVVNNVVRGAWGAALLNAEYWHWLTESTRRPGGTTAAPAEEGQARIEC